MKANHIAIVLALVAGVLLSSMIFIISVLSRQTSPVWSSFVAHLIGAVVAIVLWFIFEMKTVNIKSKSESRKIPYWAYLAGIPGVVVVILASVTVNSRLALSGSLAVMLLGQVMFGLLVDATGFLGMPVRRLKLYDVFEILTILIGSGVLIFFAR